MKKDLKFRCYDADENKMHYDEGIEPLYFTLFEYMGNKLLPPKQVGYIGKDCDNVHIMQYTGLNDKNDKEVYEGDVCSENGKFVIVEYSID